MNNFNPCPKCEEKRQKEHAALLEIIANGYGKMSQGDYNETLDRLSKASQKSYSLKEHMDYYLKSGKIYYQYSCFCSVCQYEVNIKDGVLNLM